MLLETGQHDPLRVQALHRTARRLHGISPFIAAGCFRDRRCQRILIGHLERHQGGRHGGQRCLPARRERRIWQGRCRDCRQMKATARRRETDGIHHEGGCRIMIQVIAEKRQRAIAGPEDVHPPVHSLEGRLMSRVDALPTGLGRGIRRYGKGRIR